MTEIIYNPSGIPKAPFVDSVEKFLENGKAEPVLRKFDETLLNYKRMEEALREKVEKFKVAIPELKQGLEYIEMFDVMSEPKALRFQIAESLYGKAIVSKPNKVNIWIGANVMVEFQLEEAKDFLSERLKKAQEYQKVTEEDLEFIREQITTCEVNLARVYNWDVKNRKENKESN